MRLKEERSPWGSESPQQLPSQRILTAAWYPLDLASGAWRVNSTNRVIHVCMLLAPVFELRQQDLKQLERRVLLQLDLKRK